ncbi:MAG: J domain-containing protein [Haloferacaceae archaeon]
MDRRRLVLGLAAVFAGLTAVLSIAALVVQPFLIVLALPFAATTYFLWFHATGRLANRARPRGTAARSHAAGDDRRRRFAEWIDDRVPGATGRDDRARARGRATTGSRFRGSERGRAGRRRHDRRRAAGSRSGTHRQARTDPIRPGTGLSRAEACRILGVPTDADRETIKAAYREQVKRTHPDTAGGDEESFKRLTRAYERLKGESPPRSDR